MLDYVLFIGASSFGVSMIVIPLTFAVIGAVRRRTDRWLIIPMVAIPASIGCIFLQQTEALGLLDFWGKLDLTLGHFVWITAVNIILFGILGSRTRRRIRRVRRVRRCPECGHKTSLEVERCFECGKELPPLQFSALAL